MTDTTPASATTETTAVTTTPSAPPAADTSAPSTSAPPARPTSMQHAFEQVAARKSAGKEGTATTVPPATSALTGSPEAEKGPVPFPVHDTAIKNARTKARAEALAEYGLGEATTPQILTEMRHWYDRAQRDTAGFFEESILDHPQAVEILQRIIARAGSHPTHAPALRSMAARALAAGRGQTVLEMPPPDIEVTDQHGTVISHSYSAKQLQQRDQWLIQQIKAQVDKDYAPVRQTAETLAAEHAKVEATAQAHAWSGSFFQELAQYPHFEEHKAEIGQDVVRQLRKLPSDDPRQNDHAFLEAATLRAYHAVVGPKRQALDQAQYHASLKSKAVAQTESPSGVTPVSGKRPKTPRELAKFMEDRAAARAGR